MAGNATIGALRVELGIDTAQFETGLKQAGASLDATGAKMKRAAAQMESRINALRSSIDPTWAAQQRLNTQLAEANDLYKRGAISASEHAKSVAVLDQRLAEAMRGHVGLAGAQGVATRSSKVMQQAGLNLSRQFADVGVSLGSGISPMMVLIQQGPQVADAFAMAKTQGLGFSAVLKGLVASMAPFLPLLATVGAVAGAAFGGAALAARALNKDNADVAKGLGLTAKQLEHLKDKGVETGVTIGDVFKGTFNYIAGGLADVLAPIGRWFSELFDGITRVAMASVKAIVGGFAGAFGAIKATWRMLPAAIGDLTIQAANATIGALEKLLNMAAAGINKLIDKANAAARRFKLPEMGTVGQISLGRAANVNAGAASATTQAMAAAYGRDRSAALGALDRFGGGLRDSILKETLDRIAKNKGDAGAAGAGAKGPAAPRDKTDERSAEMAREIAQAQAAELQARLALTRDVMERAEIERQIIGLQAAEKAAQIDKQQADIEDDRGLSDLKKLELIAELRNLKTINATVAELQKQAVTEKAAAEVSRDALDLQTTRERGQVDLLKSAEGLLKSNYARAEIEKQILEHEQAIERATLEQVTLANGYTDTEVAKARAQLGILDQLHAQQKQMAERGTRLVDALSEAAGAAESVRSALASHDWGRVFDALQQTIETIQASFKKNGLVGGVLTAGSALASAIGGNTGSALGTGIGIAGLGFGLGTAATSLSTSLAAGGSLAGLGLSGLAPMLAGLAPLLAPIGIVVGTLYAAAKLLNVGGKPSNAGAGYDLITGQLSGNKRTQETEQAATAAAQTILAAQEQLRQAGATLTATVNGLVIGTRDLTQIYLSSGQTLTSAVGDAGAAIDVAMKAILEGARFTSEAEQQLVASLLAAGKGFEEVTAALANYAAAQGLIGQVGEAILQITDPKAYDLQALKREQDARRAAIQANADAGYLTAEQFAALSDQLTRLDALEIDQVMARYADSVEDATDANKALVDAAQTALDDATAGVEQAQADLKAAYDVQAGSLRDLQREYSDLAASLRDYSATLGLANAAGPTQATAIARAAFQRIAAAAPTDKTAAGQLQGAAEAFLAASRATAPNAEAYQRDVAAVRKAVNAAAATAQSQADIAQSQLDALHDQVSRLIKLDDSVMSVAQAVARLATAMELQAAAQAALARAQDPKGANDNTDYAKYAADNTDLRANWDAGGIMRQLGATFEEAVRAHFQRTGRFEIASGLRAFDTGGLMKVGGSGGIDSQLMRYWASPGEFQVVTHTDPLAAMSAQSEALKVAAVGIRELVRMNKRWDADGLPETRVVA